MRAVWDKQCPIVGFIPRALKLKKMMVCSHGRIKAWARRARAQGPHEKKAPTTFEINNKIIKFKIKFKPKSTFSQYTYVK